jgi:hypothetical protein
MKHTEWDFGNRLGVLKAGDNIVFNPYVCASNEFNGTIKEFETRKNSMFEGKPFVFVRLDSGRKIGMFDILRRGTDGYGVDPDN